MADYQSMYQEIKGSLATLMHQNNMLKQQLKDAYEELSEKQLLKEEWQSEIQKVQECIVQFQQDNEYLAKEVDSLESTVNEQRVLIQQQSEQINLLKENGDKWQTKYEQLKQLADGQQSKLFELENQHMQLKQQSSLRGNDLESQLQQTDSQWSKKYKDLEIKLAQELDGNRRQYQYEIEKLSAELDHVQIEKQKLNQQNDQLQNNIYELREGILEREINLKQLREEWHKQTEGFQISHYEEIKKLQNIIENQSALIQSYERVIEIEKNDYLETQPQQNHIQLEDQLMEMKNKNIMMCNKLQEASTKLEHQTAIHSDEIKKLQSIIDDQKELIHQYERIKEKDQKQFEKLQNVSHAACKEQYEDISNHNIYLKQRIQEMQHQLEQKQQSHKYTNQENLGNSDIYLNKDDSFPNREQGRAKEIIREKEYKRRQAEKLRELEIEREVEREMRQQIEKERELEKEREKEREREREREKEWEKEKEKEKEKNREIERQKEREKERKNKYLKEKDEQLKDTSNRPPKTYFSNSKLSALAPTKKRSFHTNESDESNVQQQAEKEFQEEFLMKFQNVITRMEDKLGKIQSELNINDHDQRRIHRYK